MDHLLSMITNKVSSTHTTIPKLRERIVKVTFMLLLSTSLLPAAVWAKEPHEHAGGKANKNELSGGKTNKYAADICQLFTSLINTYSADLTLPDYCRVYALGDTGPAGGTVFYVSDGGLHGMEVAPDTERRAPWGCFDQFIDGAFGTNVGTGAANTQAIVANCGTDTAAGIADSYKLNGYKDWFLPSSEELEHYQRFIVGQYTNGCFLDDYSYNDKCSVGSLWSSTTTTAEHLDYYPRFFSFTDEERNGFSIRFAWIMETIEFGNLLSDGPFTWRSNVLGLRIVRAF